MNAFPPQQASAPAKLAGMVLASFVLCITIVILRGSTIAAYVYAIRDIPGVKMDVAAVAINALVLGYYIWSAVGIYRGDVRGYQRLVRMSIVFGVITIAAVAYNTSTIPHLDAVREMFPLLWGLVVPIPIGLAVMQLATAFVAYRAKTAVESAPYGVR